jgi:hypothetical protein
MTIVSRGFPTYAIRALTRGLAVTLLVLLLVGLAMALRPTNGNARLTCEEISPYANPVSHGCGGVSGLTGIAEHEGQPYPDLAPDHGN